MRGNASARRRARRRSRTAPACARRATRRRRRARTRCRPPAGRTFRSGARRRPAPPPRSTRSSIALMPLAPIRIVAIAASIRHFARFKPRRGRSPYCRTSHVRAQRADLADAPRIAAIIFLFNQALLRVATHELTTRNAMPIYEYRCSSCGHELEALQKFSDAPLAVCPSCGKRRAGQAGFRRRLPAEGQRLVRDRLQGSGSKPAAKTDDARAKAGDVRAAATPSPTASPTPRAEAKAEREGRVQVRSEVRSQGRATPTPAPAPHRPARTPTGHQRTADAHR